MFFVFAERKCKCTMQLFSIKIYRHSVFFQFRYASYTPACYYPGYRQSGNEANLALLNNINYILLLLLNCIYVSTKCVHIHILMMPRLLCYYLRCIASRCSEFTFVQFSYYSSFYGEVGVSYIQTHFIALFIY